MLNSKQSCPMEEKMKNDNTHHAINCRIPKDTYLYLQEILKVTQKNTAITVADSITHYVNCVMGKTETIKALQIDQFAWELSRKEK